MSIAHILRRSPIHKSFRVDQIKGMFDVPHRDQITQEWSVNLPLEEKPWLIGLIVGASGSGKSSIASELFKEAHHHTAFDWSTKASLLDGFDADLDTKQIVETLSSVGLSSPPHWLKPYQHLSTGQKFRADLARLILSGHERIVFDEFTSVVDRDVAKISCAATAKTIRRRQRPQLVAISCHFDILDWLQPDWVFDVGANRFEWRILQRRPAIKLSIHEADTSSWAMFRNHHYLSSEIHRASKAFVALWNDKPVAFAAYMHFPHPSDRKMKREHRVVVLPDFQGVGIGNALSEHVAAACKAKGFRYFSISSHPSMIGHRSRSKLWRCVRAPGHTPPTSSSKVGVLWKAHGISRLTASFEFIGSGAASAIHSSGPT